MTHLLSAVCLSLLLACSSAEPSPPEQANRNPLCAELRSRSSCVPEGFEQCSPDASPDATIAIGDPMSRAVPAYDNPDCPGRFLYEVDTEGFVASENAFWPVWLTTVWDITKIATPEVCAQVVIDTAVQRERSPGVWEEWDAFRVIGEWTSLEACETVICGGGKLPDGTLNDTTGAPHTWVDIEGVSRVRVVISAHDQACNQHEIMFAAREAE